MRAANKAANRRNTRANALRHAGASFAVAGAGLAPHRPVVNSALAEWEWRSAGGTHHPLGDSARN